MATGLYPNTEVIERFLGTVATGPLGAPFVAPYDCDVLGMVLSSTAAATGAGCQVNCSNVLTSQQSGTWTSGTPINPNPTIPSGGFIWTVANCPTILAGNKMNIVPLQPQVVQNVPYSLNYPLPGPGGTQGFVTAQQTTLYTTTPVLAPPQQYKYQMSVPVPPDQVYTDMNGIANSPCSFVHVGDVLQLNVIAIGGGANLQAELILAKR